MTELNLTPIKERLAKATPGPWRVWQDPRPGYEKKVAVETVWAHGDIEGDTELITDYLPTRADARFIAEAPADIEALIAEVERLQKENERLQAQLDAVKALTLSPEGKPMPGGGWRMVSGRDIESVLGGEQG